MNRKVLSQVLDALEHDGVLEGERRREVERRLEAALFATRDRSGVFISILATFGCVLIGAGILSWVAFNWDALSKPYKLALLIGAWAAIHAAGFWLVERPHALPRVGRALTVLGVLAFGAVIYLIAQIYHLTAEYPNAVLLWWALHIPLALWTRSRAILFFITALFLVWAYLHTAAWFGHVSIHGAGDTTLLACFLMTPMLGALLAGLAEWSRMSRWAPFAKVLRPIGLPLILAGPYILSFEDAIDGVGRFQKMGLAPMAVAGACAVAAALAALRMRARPIDLAETCAGIGFASIAAVCLFYGWSGTYLLANAVLLVGLLLLIHHGVQRHDALAVNFGVAFFLLAVMSRYVEYVWDRLAGAAGFIGAGVILLGLGIFLEKRRRVWLSAARRPA